MASQACRAFKGCRPGSKGSLRSWQPSQDLRPSLLRPNTQHMRSMQQQPKPKPRPRPRQRQQQPQPQRLHNQLLHLRLHSSRTRRHGDGSLSRFRS